MKRYFICRYTISRVINNLYREERLREASERARARACVYDDERDSRGRVCIPVGGESRSTVRSANNGYWTLIVFFHAHKL